MSAARSSLGESLARGEISILRQLVALLGEAITVRDLNGRIVFANQVALEQFGFGSLTELLNRPGLSIMTEYRVSDESGNPLSHEQLPSVRLLAGETAEPLLIRMVHRRTGELTWNLLKASPLVDEDDQLAGAVTMIEDVTAVKRAEMRTRVLAESGQILASSLQFEQTLRNVAEIAVPSIADYCGVDIFDDAGRLARVAAMFDDTDARDLAGALGDLPPVIPDPDQDWAHVLSTGESLYFAEITTQKLASVARDAEHLELLRRLGVRSYLSVPMRVPDRTIGLMTLVTTAHSGRTLDEEDVALAEQLGRRAAVAVENARLHTKLESVANTLQRSLAPNPLPQIPLIDVAALYRPATSNLRIDVGGDFYEFFEHHGVWYVIFGDVAGKGVSAASITTLMRHGARVVSRAEPQPGKILGRLNEALLQFPVSELATALCACIHPDHIVISSAGHPPAMLVAADGGIREVPAPGPLLGAFSNGNWPEQEFRLAREELLVLFTDGVIEASGADSRYGTERLRYGTERLRALLSANAGMSPELVLERLEADLAEFVTGPVEDDVAVLVMRTRTG